MDNQDKIFEKFKVASQNAEAKDFPAMEKVWSRVEDKLDKKEAKKTISLWKKIAVAASLLLVISLGSQFLKSDKNKESQNNKIVVTDSVETKIKTPTLEKENVVVSSSEIILKEEATQILEKQINQHPVALNEIQSKNSSIVKHKASPIIANEVVIPAQAAPKYEVEYNDNSILKEKAVSENNYFQAKKSASYDLTKSEREAQMARKSAPLIILNGNAMSHNDDAKRDKMMQEELLNLKPENVESLIILDDPLYIIDGIYYSENDLFGTKPTSPYAPLNKQDIKTIAILQDLEATSKYGEKGKKGVVIITTKTGKPILKQ